MNEKLKTALLVTMILFYLFAGINHFLHPDAYISIIPSYFRAHELINTLAGFGEIGGGLLLIFPSSRKPAAWGIIAILAAFLPVHVYMLQHAPMQMSNITITPLIAWIRLPLQAVLISWAYLFAKE